MLHCVGILLLLFSVLKQGDGFILIGIIGILFILVSGSGLVFISIYIFLYVNTH